MIALKNSEWKNLEKIMLEKITWKNNLTKITAEETSYILMKFINRP